MTLQKTIECICQKEWYLELHPSWKKHPQLCVWCEGREEYETPVTLYHYKGDFESLRWDDISNPIDDFVFIFICNQCKDEVILSEGGDTVACICGCIYRLNCSVVVDKAYIGDIESIIELSNGEDENEENTDD